VISVGFGDLLDASVAVSVCIFVRPIRWLFCGGFWV